MSVATKRQEHTTSDFYCTKCGRKGIPIVRRAGQQREAGHLKKLFCLYCQEETNHAEVRPFGAYNVEDFKEEFELGRFVDGQKTLVAELMSCTNIKCKYNKSGKCWNSNHSYNCGHRIIKENPNDETKNLLNRGGNMINVMGVLATTMYIHQNNERARAEKEKKDRKIQPTFQSTFNKEKQKEKYK